MRLDTGVRAFALLCVMGVVAASWVPQNVMVRTGASGSLEHLGAYSIPGLALIVAFRRFRPASFIAGLIVLAAILEAGQRFVPGRHADISDFGAGGLGAFLRLTFAVLWRRGKISPSTRRLR
jgi:VanZ family protein